MKHRVLLHPLLLGSLLLLAPAAGMVAQTATFVSSFGSFGTADGQFQGCFGLARNPSNGDLFVSDNSGQRVQKFDAAGNFIFKFGVAGAGPGQFNGPTGLAFDGSSLYVVDTGNNRIHFFSGGGLYQGQWGTAGAGDGQFNQPWGIAIRPVSTNFRVYVSDYFNHRVQAFQADGTFTFKWGSNGATPGQFNLPLGLAINQSTGQIYVADRGNNNRVQRFSSTGDLELTWGSLGGGPGQFNGPRATAVDPAGRVYVSDGTSRIQRFSADGEFQFSFGSFGAAPGQFAIPHAMLAFARPGGGTTLVVADTFNDRVQIFAVTEPRATVSVRGSRAFSTPRATVLLRGSATAASRVEVKVGTSRFRPARGIAKWSFPARLRPGRNVLVVRAINADAVASRPVRVVVQRR